MGPPRIDARVFSGTGNSLRAARWFVAGADADVRMLDGPDAAVLRGDALVLLATPTHGFTAPWAAVRFVRALPPGAGRKAAVLCTRAGLVVGRWHPPGLAGTAPFVLALALALRGYRVVGALTVNMPSNWLSLHTGLSAAAVEAIVERGAGLVARFAARVREGRAGWLTLNLGYELVFGLLFAPVSMLYLLVATRLLGQYFFANHACTGCGTCARACPLDAISVRGSPARPDWSTRCTSCMRCMAFCPRRAIEASWSWGLVTTLLSLLPGLAWYAAFGVPRLTGRGWVDVSLLLAAWTALSVAVMPSLTRAWWRVLGSAAVNRAFFVTTPTRWYRRYREPTARLLELAPRLRKRRR